MDDLDMISTTSPWARPPEAGVTLIQLLTGHHLIPGERIMFFANRKCGAEKGG